MTAIEIWRNYKIPVIYRQKKGLPILVKLPYNKNNYELLRGDHTRKPSYNSRFKCYETPYSWFDDLIKRLLFFYDCIYLIQPYREKEICAPACWNAEGLICECSCMGENHGAGQPEGRWYEINETFAILWHEKKSSCNLIRSKEDLP